MAANDVDDVDDDDDDYDDDDDDDHLRTIAPHFRGSSG